MMDVFNERGGSVLATQTVEGPAISAYGVLAGVQDPNDKRIYECTGMVEKPKFADAPSKQAIIGRYVLTPRIFELLEQATVEFALKRPDLGPQFREYLKGLPL